MFPAYAGVILNIYDANEKMKCVPRVCGGDPGMLTE